MNQRVKLIGKSEAAENTLLLSFEKPEDFTFNAGQFVSIKLVKIPHEDAKGNQKVFSIASAPFQDTLEFSMRKSKSAFKRNIDLLEIGEEIEITAPVGRFSLSQEPDTGKAIVFLVGGIGITPARSILLEANHTGRPENFFLFYSNRRPEDAAFIEEFNDIPNINLTVINTMTDMGNSRFSWDGETGFITKEMIAKYVPDFSAIRCYVVGTGGFINAMKEMLLENGINTEDIHYDNFG